MDFLRFVMKAVLQLNDEMNNIEKKNIEKLDPTLKYYNILFWYKQARLENHSKEKNKNYLVRKVKGIKYFLFH